MPYHTYLDLIVEPIKDEIDNYNWIVSDVEYHSTITDLPIDMHKDYSIFSPSEFRILLNSHVQLWWCVVLAVSTSAEIKLDENNLPYAEGNDLIWENGSLQHQNAEIEIDCFDSGYTIIKFTDKNLSEKFKDFFGGDAIPLDDFNKRK